MTQDEFPADLIERCQTRADALAKDLGRALTIKEAIILVLRASKHAELVAELALVKSAHGANARVRRRIRRVNNFDGEKAFLEVARKLEAMKERNAELVAAADRIIRSLLAAAGQGEPK